MKPRVRFLVFGSLLLACSSGERARDEKVEAPLRASGTIALLKTFPGIGPRVVGAPLARVPGGFTADLDPKPNLAPGPQWVDSRDLATGFYATLPARAGSPMRVGVSDTVWIDVTAEGDAPVSGTRVDGAIVYGAARPGVDVVLSAERRHVEEVRLLRSPQAGSTLRYRLKAGPGVREVRVRDGVVEVLDETGTARLRTDRWFAVDANHNQLELAPSLSGVGADRVLEARVPVEGAAYPIAVDPGWGSPAALAIPRRFHTVTALPSGKVMVAGGESTGALATSAVEIFDPTTRTWTFGKSMSIPRSKHGAAIVTGGKVFVVGTTGAGTPCAAGSTTELYDPGTDTWTASGSMSISRGEPAVAVLSPSGKVFVGAGRACGGPTDPSNTGEVWNPSTGTFTPVPGTMSSGHGIPSFAPFGTDKAVIAGGWPGYGATSNGEVYDGATNTFSSAPKMTVDRGNAPTVVLDDGRVLIIGGAYYSGGDNGRSTVDVFVPAAGVFSAPVAAMPEVRYLGPATKLTSGKVLVSHGNQGYPSYAWNTTSYLYDPGANTWSLAGSVVEPRGETGMAPLPGGGAIVPGGRTGSNTPVSTVEIWADAVAGGSACASGAQCTSGLCYDGVCCDRKCDQQCEACNEPSSVGTCKLVTGAPRGTRAACSGTGTCAGSCNGSLAACSYPSTSVVCAAATCIGGISTGAALCNGTGTCNAAPASTNCAPFNCGATSCKTTCTTDTDCVSSAYCNSSGACVVKKTQGTACTTDASCATGYCADGVCCATACPSGGTCQSCNVSGSVGVCTAIPCDAGADSAPDTMVADTAVADTAVADTGSTIVDAVAETPAPNWGATPTVAGTFQKCSKNSECPSGFCVEGICCDSACTDRCHSCALLTSPGKCTLEPIGVDLKNECGAALSCLGTCGGSGECIGAGQGTMCGRNRCTGPSKGVGPAYCPGPGGKCGTDEAVPFDCAPYLCEPAFGACSTGCTGSDDCVRGYTCDIPTKTCVALPPPAEEESGCAIGTPGAGHSSAAALALLALAAAARRRRR